MADRIDATSDEHQCTARLYGRDGIEYLCCRFVAGHDGKHQTCYVNGSEWDEAVPSPSKEKT